MPYRLSQQSLNRLVGVHPELVAVVKRAIELTKVDFTVLEGLRTMGRQKDLVATGASWTLNSRHLTGHAVDLGAWVLGELRWDWPLYYKLADAMFKAADELDVVIEWGGNWNDYQKDGPHFQLSWKEYPKDEIALSD